MQIGCLLIKELLLLLQFERDAFAFLFWFLFAFSFWISFKLKFETRLDDAKGWLDIVPELLYLLMMLLLLSLIIEQLSNMVLIIVTMLETVDVAVAVTDSSLDQQVANASSEIEIRNLRVTTTTNSELWILRISGNV